MLNRTHGLARGVEIVSSFAMTDAIRREMDLLFGVAHPLLRPTTAVRRAQLRDAAVEVDDTGAVTIRIDLPGVSEREVEVTYERGFVNVRAKRHIDSSDGWTVRHSERESFELRERIRVPVDIDPEQASASLREGCLVITLPKAPESQPRRLTVRTAASN